MIQKKATDFEVTPVSKVTKEAIEIVSKALGEDHKLVNKVVEKLRQNDSGLKKAADLNKLNELDKVNFVMTYTISMLEPEEIKQVMSELIPTKKVEEINET